MNLIRHRCLPFAALLGVILVGTAFGHVVSAQDGGARTSSTRWQQSRISGELDADVPAPVPQYTSLPESSQASPTNTAASSGQATRWEGLEGTGTISYGKEGPELPATLSISPDGNERLDVTLDNGTRSLRILGFVGKLREQQGKTRQLPIRNAVVSLIPTCAFPFASVSATTIENEMQQVTIAGGAYTHKRFEFHPTYVSDPTKHGRPAFATEVYTTPSTSETFKTVDYVDSMEPLSQSYVRVITYEDYKTVDGVGVPTKFTETIDGQKAYVLKLTSVQLTSSRTQAEFSF